VDRISREKLKEQAGIFAGNMPASGMVIGLGSGSTAKYATLRIGERLRSGDLQDIVAIPSSEETASLATSLGIPLVTFRDCQRIDITIDGADEVNPRLDLIKGGGGALLREKVLAQASLKNIIIVDPSKISSQLGKHWPVPVEVLRFAVDLERIFLADLGATVKLREAEGEPYLTDEGNYILDANFGLIHDPERLALSLSQRAGIVEHGLFIGLATEVVVAGENGPEVLRRS